MPREVFLSTAQVEYTGDKRCSARICLPFSSASLIRNDSGLILLKVSTSTGLDHYFSLSMSDIENNNTHKILLNRLYCKKLNIFNHSSVSLSVLNNVPQCTEAYVKPLTTDDWQIIQLHANEVESSLLEQVRVIWPNQIFPIWIKQVCIYMKTVEVRPQSKCVLLVPETKMIVDPEFGDLTEKGEQEIQSRDTDAISDTKMDVSSAPHPRKMHQLIVHRILSLIKFLWRLLQRIYRATIKKILQTFNTKKSLPDKTEPHVPEAIIQSALSLPNDFNVIFRVEPMGDESRFFNAEESLIPDQASTVVYHSPDFKTDDCDCVSSQVLLVQIRKLMSPKDKKALNVNKSNEGEPINSDSDEAVVRLCIHEISKFSNLISSEGIDAIKVSSLVRRQLNLPISSVILIQKLKKVPLIAKDGIDKITFTISTSSKISNDIHASVDFYHCFMEWLNLISDRDHPIPLCIGSLVTFQCHYQLENSQVFSTPFEFVLTGIKMNEDSEIVALPSTFLLSSDDLQATMVEFITTTSAKSKTLSEVEFNMPLTTKTLLCKAHRKIANDCISLAKMALQYSPYSVNDNLTCPNSKIYLVTGPKGVGKTSICESVLHELASRYHTYVHSVECFTLRGKRPDVIKGLLGDIIEELKWRQPSALLLDNIDQLCSSPTNDENQIYDTQISSIIKQLLSMLIQNDKSKIMVLATSATASSMNSMLTRKKGCHMFGTSFDIALPEAQTRIEMLLSNLSNIALESDIKYNADDLSKKTEGFSARDLKNITKMVIHNQNVIKKKNGGKARLANAKDIENALQGYTPISLLGAKLHKPVVLEWSDIGGLESVKTRLIEQLMWPLKYANLFAHCGIQLQSGILLYGAPGCGKTLLAGIVANESKLNFISVKGPELLNKYIGASEAAVRDLFMRASAAAPCVLFFDEFDSIAPPRGHDSTGVTDRVVNQLLTHLDGVEPLEGVFVMAATSRPDLIDLALLRPGRLDNHMFFPFPDAEERFSILKALSKSLTLADDVDLKIVAESCEGFSGADLKALLYDAQLEALHGATEANEDFGTVSKKVESELEFSDLYSITGRQFCEEELASSKYSTMLNQSLSSRDKLMLTNYGTVDERSDLLNTHAKMVHMPHIHSGIAKQIPHDVVANIEKIHDLWNTPSQVLCAEEKEKSASKISASILVTQSHIEKCLKAAKPSLSSSEKARYDSIYMQFSGNFQSKSTSVKKKVKQRMTLA